MSGQRRNYVFIIQSDFATTSYQHSRRTRATTSAISFLFSHQKQISEQIRRRERRDLPSSLSTHLADNDAPSLLLSFDGASDSISSLFLFISFSLWLDSLSRCLSVSLSLSLYFSFSHRRRRRRSNGFTLFYGGFEHRARDVTIFPGTIFRC